MSAHVDRKTLELSAERIDAPVLSVLEWKVVDLAIREAAGSGGTLYAPTGFRRFFQRLGSALFGWTYAQPLADERLEMLRRFAGAFRRDVKRAEAMAAKLDELLS